jgi:predicted Fe-Mo cluster-binding NifX family protein
MKIAVSASSPDLEGSVDPRFGRCALFLIVDTETLAADAVENPYVSASGGAGIQAAQLVAEKGVNAVLTGSCGPNAFQTLSAAGVEVVTGVTGSIRDAVRSYRPGTGAGAVGGPNVPPHFGMGMGMGGGRGQGRGGGRGGGLGAGRSGPGSQPGFPPSAPPDDLNALHEQSRLLRERLDQITKKIAQIEKDPEKEHP